MPINNLSSALTILSAMITPAILIMASGSLSLTTSNRLSRSIDRVRKMSERLGKLSESEGSKQLQELEKNFLTQQLLFASRRCRLLQQAMTSLYLTITIFVGTIIAIGILETLGLSYAWVLLLLGFSGVAILFYACIMLILESKLALHSVNKEMDYTVDRYLTSKYS